MENKNTNKKIKASSTEQRSFLLSAITWQEGLLQAYRSVHVTIQGLLLTAGVAVFAIQLNYMYELPTTDETKPITLLNSIFSLTLISLFWIQSRAAIELGKVIRSRADDVDFWHKELVLLENEFPRNQRTLSKFKIWQQAKRSSTTHLFAEKLENKKIKKSQIDIIIKKGLEHTRHVLDTNLFNRIKKLWITMLVCSIGISICYGFIYVNHIFNLH